MPPVTFPCNHSDSRGNVNTDTKQGHRECHSLRTKDQETLKVCTHALSQQPNSGFSAVAWQLWQAWLYIEQTMSPFVFQHLCLNFSRQNIQTSAYCKYIGTEVSLKRRGDLHLINSVCFDSTEQRARAEGDL